MRRLTGPTTQLSLTKYMEIAGFRNEGGNKKGTWDLRFFSASIGIGLRFFQCHDVRPKPTLLMRWM